MLFGSGKPVIGRASTIIHRPVDEVFEFIGVKFLTNYPRWSPEVVKLEQISKGPIEKGALLKQARVDHGHRSESTFRVTEYSPPHHFAVAGVSNAYRCTYELVRPETNPESTLVTFSFEFPELEGFLRPFEKLVRVAVQDGAVRTVRNLKGLIEREAASK